MPAAIVAVIVIVAVPPSGASEPFQVTVFVPTVATAVPDVAFAETSVTPAGRTSVYSFPGLSACPIVPAFVRVTV